MAQQEHSSNEPPALKDQNFGRSHGQWRSMNDQDGLQRAARAALEIFRSKVRVVGFLALAALGAWPTTKLLLQLNEQNAQQNPPVLKGDSFLRQIAARERFSVDKEYGHIGRAKYVQVSGFAHMVQQKEAGEGRYGGRLRSYYSFEPLTTNSISTANLGASLSLINAGETNLSLTNFSSALVTNVARTNILVTALSNSELELIESSESEIPKDGRKFPVTFVLSNEKGYHRIQTNDMGTGKSEPVHVFNAISLSWGHVSSSNLAVGATNVAIAPLADKRITN